LSSRLADPELKLARLPARGIGLEVRSNERPWHVLRKYKVSIGIQKLIPDLRPYRQETSNDNQCDRLRRCGAGDVRVSPLTRGDFLPVSKLFLAFQRGVKLGAVAKHSAGDIEQPIADRAESAGVTVTALSQSRVLRAAATIVLRSDARPR
jgi:hypothetical protein